MNNALEFFKIIEKKGYKLIKQGLKNEDVLNEFSDLSKLVCSYNDALISCLYAETFSSFCYGNSKAMKALKLDKLQDIVMKGNNEELMYRFGTRVCGADLRSLIEAMPYGSSRKQLEREIQPINEANL